MPRHASVPAEADRMAREISRLIRRSPGDRSVLRHSLGQAPEEVSVGVHKIVVPLLPKDAADGTPRAHDVERAYYAVAALIASQQRPARDQAGGDGTPDDPPGAAPPDDPAGKEGTPPGRQPHNLGYSLARAVHQGSNRKSTEDRLQLLARQDVEGVYRHLPRLILQLSGDQVQIDWGVLVHDLTRWAREPRLVAKEWVQEFYRTDERLTAEDKRKAEKATTGTSTKEA
jgi:CRISPR system Cascade subunit CasB